MADPLSISASIAGVVTLADAVFGRLHKYAKKAKDAPAEVKELSAQVNQLGGLHNSLARLARTLDDELFDVSLRMQHVDSCSFILTKLDKMLQKAEKDLEKPGQLDRLQRKMKWPFSTSQIKEYMTELSIHQESISLALSADTMNGLLHCLSFERKILDTTEDIRREVRETRKITRRIEESSERTKILNAFLKNNPQEGYEMSLNLRHPRTGLWLLRLPAFQTWLDIPGSKLWLSGIPGAGKTVLAASIIEAALTRSSDKIAVGFYFCDYKTEATWTPANILSVIATQLALQSEEAYEELASFYERLHPPNGLPRNPRALEMSMILSTMTSKFDRVFIIVDALDECGQYTPFVVETLTSYANDNDNTCVALLSRDEDEIRFGLGDDFQNMEIAAHSEDVAEYVSSEIQERVRTGRLRVGGGDLLAEIQQKLVNKAHGMFRWVTCQLDHLGECQSDQACREALDTLPPDLEETYVRILQRIKQSQQVLAEMTLNFVGYISKDLSIPMLQQAVSVRPDQRWVSPQNVIYEEAISRACSSLIRKTNDGNHFEFAHFSVREFLESENLNRVNLDRFRISQSRCSMIFTSQCLQYIQLDNFAHDRWYTTPQFHDEEVPPNNRIPPFYEVAAISWLRHGRHGWEHNGEFRGLAEKLFDRQKTATFLFWAIYLLDRLHGMTIKDVTNTRLLPTESGELSMTSIVQDPSFTPLHLAAILGIPEICQKLIGEGVDASLVCRLGSPMSCAVSSIGALQTDVVAHSVSALPEIKRLIHRDDEQSLPHDISKTVSCIINAEKSGSSVSSIAGSPTLMRSAISTSGAIADFSMIPTLLQNGIEASGEDSESFRVQLTILCRDIASKYPVKSGSHAQRLVKSAPEMRLETLIRSLNNLIDVFPSALALCSIAWKEAVEQDLSFTSDITIVNTQISLDDEALKELGFAGAAGGDITKLNAYLDDPRTSVDTLVRGKTSLYESTLLHCALGRSHAGFRGFESHLAVTRRLLEAGCLPTIVNNKGQTPLHVWSWGEDADETQQQKLEDIARSLFHKGPSIQTKDIASGANALHCWASRGSIRTLRAVLRVASADDAESALETTDDEGATPLMRAIECNHVDTAKLLLRYGGNGRDFIETLDKSKLLSLMGGIDSTSLLQELISVGFPIISDDGDSALHHVKGTTPVDCIKALKEYLPDHCSRRFEERLPVEIYLRGWFSNLTNEADQDQSVDNHDRHFKAIEELSNLSNQMPRDTNGMSVWSYAVTCMRMGRPSSQSRHIICAGLGYIVQLGYMRSHEKRNSECGLIPLLRVLDLPARRPHDSWPVSPEFLMDVAKETGYWHQFCTSPMALDLLHSAYSPKLHLPLIRFLLEKNVFTSNFKYILDVHKVLRSLGILECNDESLKPGIQTILDHFNKVVWTYDSEIIHYSRSTWIMEEFIRRGANPNMRTSLHQGHVPALVHHIWGRRLDLAACLLKNGARPGDADTRGINALHAAIITGNVGILESILLNFSFPSWYRAEFNHLDKILLLDVLHISALEGKLDCVEFLLKHDEAHEFRHKDHAWQAIHLAAMKGHDGIITFMHKQGFDINARNPKNGYTPLHAAVEERKISTVKMLIQLGATSTGDQQGRTPLVLALLLDSPEIVAAFDQTSNGVDSISDPSLVHSSHLAPTNHRLIPVFEQAVRQGNLALCMNLRQLGCPLDGDLSCGGCSLLQLALALCESDIALWLVREGASMIKSSRKCFAHSLHIPPRGRRTYRCHRRYLDSVPVLCLKCICINMESTEVILRKYVEDGGDIFNTELLISATESESPENLRAWLNVLKSAWNRSVNDDNTAGTTSDMFRKVGGINQLVKAYSKAEGYANQSIIADYIANALQDGEPYPPSATLPILFHGWETRLEDVKFHSASLWTCPDGKGETPIHVSCRHLSLDVIRFLLRHGVDYQTLNVYGESVLLTAIDVDSLEKFSLFLSLGVTPHHQDMLGISPIHVAMSKETFTASILNHDLKLSETAPIPWQTYGYKFVVLFTRHFRSPYGSALMLACAACAVPAVKLLVYRGASLYYETSAGQRRSALAAASASSSLTQWLLVTRFTEQPKLCSSAATDREEEACKPWSGSVKAEYLIMESDERNEDESSFDYCKRLMEIRR
ncbi:uncharacterized protein PG998_006597, partial [Apiospora kogelbergensis]|uniref:uncharacterized protein n=1 Tax=Apiospora kogelbergensis TaxID=1337665 RepID=UPI00312F803D